MVTYKLVCEKCKWEQSLWTWKKNPFRTIWEQFIWCVYWRDLYEEDPEILLACHAKKDSKLVNSYRYFWYILKREVKVIFNQYYINRSQYESSIGNGPIPCPKCKAPLFLANEI